jgi:16S rRNA (uracil1498-N3)-methyltransferase
MRIPRVYQSISLAEGREVSLDVSASQYLVKVLRLRESARLIVFDGQGNSYEAELTSIRGKQATVKLLNQITADTESPLQIHVGLGISKGERMDYAIQKLVETGVHSITPLSTEYTVVKLDSKRKQTRLQHWQGVVISACEQCGRNYLPELYEADEISHWLANTDSELKLAFDASGDICLRNIKTVPRTISILIGPEGGLSDNELDYARTHAFSIVRLGPRILRTETAAVAISAALQTLWGDY